MNRQVASKGSTVRERALLARVAAGDRSAIAALYKLYFPRLFKFVYRITRDYAATEEVVNDVMLTIWQKAGEFRGESKISTWILGIAYRQSLRWYRNSRRRREVEATPDVIVESADLGVSFESSEWLERALDRLSVEQRMVIELAFYVGLSYQEVAEVVDCPVNTVKTRAFYARRRLKVILCELDEMGGELK